MVIASTGTNKFAFASDQGAFFSDAFFTTAASGGSLLTAFNNGKAAVLANGSTRRRGWTTMPAGPYTRRRRGSGHGALPVHQLWHRAALHRHGRHDARRHHRHRQRHGAGRRRRVKTVWAPVFPPSYTPPTTTTMSLGVPMVQLDANPETPGLYAGGYGGFTEDGSYRVVVYAVDNSDNGPCRRWHFTGATSSFCRW